MITIGITGTIGAGKGTVVELLKTKGFSHYSVRDFLNKEITRLGLPPTRDSMHLVADQYRKNYSPGHIMEELLKERMQNNRDAVIESLRVIGEIDIMRKNAPGFYLFAVDADAKLRYDRIRERRSSTDHITYEKFLADEKSEMDNVEPWQMNLAACIKQADFVFENNGTKDELFAKVEEVLSQVVK